MSFVKQHFSIIFFVLGFLFDLITLKRIDQTITLIQHGLFILILSVLLSLIFLKEQNHIQFKIFSEENKNIVKAIVHFLFGSLLSAFTIFYFKSSSLMTSFLFLSLLTGLLLINEHPKFQDRGLKIKFSLLALCMLSYFSYLIPTLIGFIGFIPLLCSISLVLLTLFLLIYLLNKKGVPKTTLHQEISLPFAGVLTTFLILYSFKLIPPVPLSVKYIGIYHDISRTQDGQYQLSYNRPWWKFWQNGDQDFLFKPGDKVYCFASIFSPAKFKDKIFFHWSQKVNSKWVENDKVPIAISGGRDQGYRAYSYKSQYESGEWRVQVKTENGFELSRIYFDIARTDKELDLRHSYF